MRAPGISELVQEVIDEGFFKVWVVWGFLVITYALVISGIAEDIMGFSWVVVRLDFVGGNIPQIERWASRFFTTNDTGFNFILPWCFGFYYAALIAKSNPCRENYIRSLIGRRRFMKALPRVVMCGVGMFFDVEFSPEKSCRRLCVCESQFI
ncbi:hypothetical protein [Pseudomonas sp. B22129]|uniref:hypothetical protein n=1 Tax=Pseudomonas sp. B22129 TaxID=3235111 RepID=UPI0037832AC7